MQRVRASIDPDTELALRGRPVEIPALRIEIAPPAQASYAVRDIPLLRLRGFLQRRRAIVLATAVACAVAGFLGGLCQTPKYRAVAAVEIEGESDPGMMLRALLPAGGTGGSAISDSYVETRARLLQEPALVEEALSRLNWPEAIRRRPSAVAAKLRHLARLAPASSDTSHEALTAASLASLDVHVPPQSHLIEISFDAFDSHTAADMANSLAAALVEYDLTSRWKSAQAVSDWLARPLQEFKAKYENSATALQNYAQTTGLMLNPDKGTTAAETSVLQLQDELSHAIADRILKQSRYELARSSPAESLPEVLDNGPIREYQLKLAELKRQLTDLEATFTPKFPKVVAMRSQLTDLTATISKERANILGRLKTEYEAATRREQLVSEAFQSSAKRVADQSATSIRYDVLRREMDSNQAIYESMLQKKKEAGIAAALRASNIRLVSPAQPPRAPYSPRPLLNAALAGIAGSFFSFAFFFTREHMVRSFHNPGELSCALQMQELGVIPAVSRTHFRPFGAWMTGGGKRMKAATPKASKQIEIRTKAPSLLRRLAGPKPGNIEIMAATDSESLITVSIRFILVSLWFADRGANRPRVVLVSSSRRGEGKTTLAANLAILLAQTNRRVLLIDGNLRNPRLHALFGLPNDWGLGSLLEEDMPVESYGFDDLASRTQVPGLYLLPAGASAQQVSALHYQERLEDLIARCRIEFHGVIIDTPPALDFSPDARLLGSLSDGVILAVKADETRQEEVEFACRMFREDHTQVLGFVLNNWNSAHSRNWRYRKPTTA